ncbi:MAG: hypothetical protein D6679_08225 [Candidatus Hydrogenedentota bacterium]|nr:MAG: hypothetical protein D6679_08225 [Candidatus Hydrogenedentota bacterium]
MAKNGPLLPDRVSSLLGETLHFLPVAGSRPSIYKPVFKMPVVAGMALLGRTALRSLENLRSTPSPSQEVNLTEIRIRGDVGVA